MRNFCKEYDRKYRESKKQHLDEIVTCDICDIQIKRRSLYDHKRNLHSEKTYRNHFKTKSHIDNEKLCEIDDPTIEKIKIKITLKPAKLKCNECSTNFITKTDLDEHYNRCHTSTQKINMYAMNVKNHAVVDHH